MTIFFNDRKFNSDGTTTVTPMTHSVGRTLYVAHETVRIMSDVWESLPVAHYIDEKGQEHTSICGGDGDYKVTATADATEEAYQDFYNDRLAYLTEYHTNNAVAANAVIRKGDIVKVVKGRTGKGSTGLVFWEGSALYNAGYRTVASTKYGIALSDRKVEVEKNGRKFMSYADVLFVYDRNVEKAEVLPVDAEYVKGIATRQAEKDLRDLRERVARHTK